MDQMTILDLIARQNDPEGYLVTAPESAPQAQAGVNQMLMQAPRSIYGAMHQDPSGFNSASPMDRQAYDRQGIEGAMAGASMATAGSAVPPAALGQGASPGRLRSVFDAITGAFKGPPRGSDATVLRAARQAAERELGEITQGIGTGAVSKSYAARRIPELRKEIAELEAAFKQPVSASGVSVQPASAVAQPPVQQVAVPQVGQQAAKPNPKPRKNLQTSRSNLPSGDPNILPGSASEQMRVLEKLTSGKVVDPAKLPAKQKKIYNYLLDVSRETGTPFNKLLSAMQSGKKLGKWAVPGGVVGGMASDAMDFGSE